MHSFFSAWGNAIFFLFNTFSPKLLSKILIWAIDKIRANNLFHSHDGRTLSNPSPPLYNSDRLWSPVAQDGISQWRYPQSLLSSCKYMYLSRNLTSAVVSVNQVSCQTSATNELLFPLGEKNTNKSTSASQFEFRRTWTRVIRAQIANHSWE